jgi:hypothetical protein
MHSGYPIMAGLDVQNDLVSLSRLKAGFWGPLHEIGHNHQWDPWALPGSIEASVNLWSVYAFEKVLSIPRANAMPDRVADLAPAMRAKRIQDYLAGGANFADKWKEFTALETYLQLQEGFGWEPFTQVFKQYYADAPNTDPTNDQGKIDLWVLRFSLAVNKDLGPFFRAWGFPVSAGVLTEIGTLPAWQENPMASGESAGDQCTDSHDSCSDWAASGECSNNPGYMLTNCCASCESAGVQCTDSNEFCGAWAASGECSNNPGYMLTNCCASCK